MCRRPRHRGTGALAGLVLAVLVLASGATGARMHEVATPRHEIVFSATRAAALSGEIYRVSLDGRLTSLSPSRYGGGAPRVSPDGNWVAFASGRPDGGGSGIFLVPATGGKAVQLSPPSRFSMGQPYWSHDGRQLLAVRSMPDESYVGADRLAVYVLGRTDRARRLPGTGGEFPVWSPDDRRVAFETGDYLHQSVRVVPLAGGWGWHVPGSRPAWSPAGRLALIGPGHTVRTYDARGRLLTSKPVPRVARVTWITDERLRVDAGPEPSTLDVTTGKLSPSSSPPRRPYDAVSPDGKHVASIVRAGNAMLLRAGPRGGHMRTLVRFPRCDSGPVSDLQFASGGTALVYATTCDSPPPSLYVIGEDGDNVRQLTHAPDYVTAPRLSPDGRAIAYESGSPPCPGCSVTIGRMDADGRHARVLTSPRQDIRDASPSWSPDGASIVFVRQDFMAGTQPRLYVVPSGGGRARPLDVIGSSPSWGPKGIAYERGEAIWLVAADGSHPRKLVNGASPAWSHDGRLAYWARDRNTRRAGAIVVADAAGRPVRRIALPSFPRQLAWSSDDRLLLFTGGPTAFPHELYGVPAAGGPVRRLTTRMGDVLGAS